MVSYILRRLAYMVILLVALSVVVFIVIQLPPGDMMTVMLARMEAGGADASLGGEEITAMQKQYGLHLPRLSAIPALGRQPVARQPGAVVRVRQAGDRAAAGAVAAHRAAVRHHPAVRLRGGDPDRHLLRHSSILARRLRLHRGGVRRPGDPQLPARPDPDVPAPDPVRGSAPAACFPGEFEHAPWSFAKLLNGLGHLPLPIIVIGMAGTAAIIRVMRGTLLDELRKQYVITARAKGVSETALTFKYPVRVALNPIISTVGWLLPEIVSGSTIVAIVLSLPTVAPLLFSALLQEDMFLAGSTLMVLAALTIIGTLISDLLLVITDPRIRFERV